MRKLNGFLTLVALCCCCGCGILSHLDQLSTMGDFAREKNVQGKMVDETNKHYKALVEAINTGKIKDYSSQEAIRINFGDPIAEEKVNFNGAVMQWLYRDAIPQKAKDKDKVYLYFDAEGRLIKFTQEKIQW